MDDRCGYCRSKLNEAGSCTNMYGGHVPKVGRPDYRGVEKHLAIFLGGNWKIDGEGEIEDFNLATTEYGTWKSSHHHEAEFRVAYLKSSTYHPAGLNHGWHAHSFSIRHTHGPGRLRYGTHSHGFSQQHSHPIIRGTESFRDSKIDALERENLDLRMANSRQQEFLREKQETLEGHGKKLANAVSERQRARAEMAGRGQQVRELKQTIGHRDCRINAQKQVIAERDREIERLQRNPNYIEVQRLESANHRQRLTIENLRAEQAVIASTRDRYRGELISLSDSRRRLREYNDRLNMAIQELGDDVAKIVGYEGQDGDALRAAVQLRIDFSESHAKALVTAVEKLAEVERVSEGRERRISGLLVVQRELEGVIRRLEQDRGQFRTTPVFDTEQRMLEHYHENGTCPGSACWGCALRDARARIRQVEADASAHDVAHRARWTDKKLEAHYKGQGSCEPPRSYGTWTPGFDPNACWGCRLRAEEHDMGIVAKEVGVVYEEITNGRFSKPNTEACHVIEAVEESQEQFADDAVEPYRDALGEFQSRNGHYIGCPNQYRYVTSLDCGDRCKRCKDLTDD